MDQNTLKTLLRYEPETGVFTRKVSTSNCVKAGDIVGTLDGGGYLQTCIDGRRYKLHRLAWLYVTGAWPEQQIDHIDGVRTNNRFCNLREATQSENMRNIRKHADNNSGFKGVFWHSQSKRWRASIMANGKKRYLGLFATPEEAHTAYCTASAELNGSFARYG